MRSLASPLLVVSLITAGCAADYVDEDTGADINHGDDEKADGAQGIEVLARLRPGTVDLTLTTRTPRPGFVFFAGDGARVTLEVTQAGTKAGLDTLIKVYGPRLSDGSFPKTLASDDDSGFGKLSRVKDLAIAIPGFYLVEVTNGPAATPASDARARLALSCTGTCDSDLPVAPLGLDVRWFQRAAERRALSLQAYALATARLEAKVAAGLPAQWGVVLDIDETTLDNSAYQKARAELGLGFSLATWTAWVNQKAAIPIPGALAFTRRVRELGGKVVFVTNRFAATECPATEANLATHGFAYDGILCKTTTSDKNPRFDAIASGTALPSLPPLAVVMYVGDNIQDFPALTQDIRKQADAAFAKFGDAFIALPNPMYGSWEKNVD